MTTVFHAGRGGHWATQTTQTSDCPQRACSVVGVGGWVAGEASRRREWRTPSHNSDLPCGDICGPCPLSPALTRRRDPHRMGSRRTPSRPPPSTHPHPQMRGYYLRGMFSRLPSGPFPLKHQARPRSWSAPPTRPESSRPPPLPLSLPAFHFRPFLQLMLMIPRTSRKGDATG